MDQSSNLGRRPSIQAKSHPLILREERGCRMERWSALSRALSRSKKAVYTVI